VMGLRVIVIGVLFLLIAALFVAPLFQHRP
jgi:hypothetical protein